MPRACCWGRRGLSATASPMPGRGWPGRWKSWDRPISSWARCWRRGRTLSAWKWPRRWNIFRTVCRLSRKAQARAEIARAFGKPVEALFSSFGGAAGGRLHRPGAPCPDQRQSAGAGGGENIAPRRARSNSPAIWKRWLFLPAPPNVFRRKRGGCASPRWWRPWRSRWRWNWTCAWKRRRHPSFMNAPAAKRNSACRISTGAAPPPAC